MRPADLITNYRSAYEEANGRPLVETLTYEKGWFQFRDEYGVSRFRRGTFEDMLGRLRHTARQRATQPPEAQADAPRTQDAGGDDGR